MKNIHVLPTDKPSRLILQTNGKLRLSEITFKGQIASGVTRNIYITSDEQIKKGDWVIDDEQDVFQVLEINHTQGILRSDGFTYVINICKKIILTTDQDLIKDGVQAIDDEFLEWFVKNPSCEEVEVLFDYRGIDTLKGLIGEYKITIPKQETLPQFGTKEFNDLANQYFGGKQETLEEVAENYWTKQIYNEIASIEDVKWQAKKMYSEEIIDILDNVRYWETCPNKYKIIIEEWFEQFKKK